MYCTAGFVSKLAVQCAVCTLLSFRGRRISGLIHCIFPYWIRIRIGIQPNMLDPDPDEMNADPQPCIAVFSTKSALRLPTSKTEKINFKIWSEVQCMY